MPISVRAIVLTLVVAFAALGAPGVPAKAGDAVIHTVVMGAVDPDLSDPSPRAPATAGRTDRFEYLAYYPEDLKVHRMDTVHFRRDGFHTVTFSPAGEPRRSWLRRDEAEGASAVAFREPSPTCGSDPGLPPCVLSRTSQTLSSGWDDLALTVDLDAGVYEYYCTIHEGMDGRLEVVPAHEPLLSPEEVAQARAEQVARDTAAAAALLADSQTPTVVADGDHLRWTVKVGDITADDRVAILRFMPSNLEIAPGDEVVFEVPGQAEPPEGRTEAATEIHTATFPDDPVLSDFGLLRYLNPACDADDEAAGAPGVPGMYPSLVVGCPLGSDLELLVQPWAWRSPTRAPGSVVRAPATVHDSGLLAPTNDVCRTACDPWTGARFPSTTPAASFPNSGTYGYVCLVHPEWGMAASILVTK